MFVKNKLFEVLKKKIIKGTIFGMIDAKLFEMLIKIKTNVFCFKGVFF